MNVYNFCIDPDLVAEVARNLRYSGPNRDSFRVGFQHPNDLGLLARSTRPDFRVLWVCRQRHKGVLSVIASTVPRDIRIAGPRVSICSPDAYLWEGLVRKHVPTWYVSRLRTVYCWRENNAAQACLKLFPCLKTLIIRGRRCLSMRRIFIELKLKRADFDFRWRREDVDRSDTLLDP